jgi:DNA-binding HxlR family transcriptional regulator
VPTESGLELIPVLVDLMIWGNKYTLGTGPAELVARAGGDRDTLLAELDKQTRDADEE